VHREIQKNLATANVSRAGAIGQTGTADRSETSLATKTSSVGGGSLRAFFAPIAAERI